MEFFIGLASQRRTGQRQGENKEDFPHGVIYGERSGTVLSRDAERLFRLSRLRPQRRGARRLQLRLHAVTQEQDVRPGDP